MSFEKFDNPGNGGGSPNPVLAVYPSRGARFNAAATARWFDGVDTIQFYIDADSARLGISRGGDDAGGYSLRHENGGAVVSIQGVLQAVGVDADLQSPVHLPLENDPDEGLLVADLDPLFEEVGES